MGLLLGWLAGWAAWAQPPDHAALAGNSARILQALEQDDLADLAGAMEQRAGLTDFNRTDWLVGELAKDLALAERNMPWRAPLLASFTAHFTGEVEQILEFAEAASLAGEPPSQALQPQLWLAHLEVWPKRVETFAQFVSLRETGIARLDALLADYPQDRRVAKLAAQAQIADGRIVEALGLLDELAATGPLEPPWRADADRLADWQPALDAAKIAQLEPSQPAMENRPDIVFGEIRRLQQPAEVLAPVAIEALDLTAMPPLHKLALADDRAMLDEVLPTVFDLEQTAIRGGAAYTPTHLAAELGNLDALASFAGHGADIDRPADPVAGLEAISKKLGSGVPKGTPLQIAALHGQSDMARALIGLGAVVDPSEPEQIAPLLVATARGDSTLAKNLIDAGADASLSHASLGSARDLAARMKGVGMAGDLPAQLTAGPAGYAVLQATTAMGGVGEGMSASYGIAASTMVGLVSSEAGQQLVAKGVQTSWENGTLFVRFGMIAMMMVAGYLFKSGPRLLVAGIGRLFHRDTEDHTSFDGLEGTDARHRRFMGQLRAPAFGITEGGEVEIGVQSITVHGYGPSRDWLQMPWLAWPLRLVLFVLMFAAVGVAWAAIMVAFGLIHSPIAHRLSMLLLVLLIPFLSLVAEGVIRLLTTKPMQLDIFHDDVQRLDLEPVRQGLRLVARISRPGAGQGELVFAARHANTVQALLAELQRFTFGRTLRTI